MGERERMAAALFGGVVESVAAPAVPPAAVAPAVAAAAPPVPAPVAPPVPANVAPAPAPELDLLDLGFDATPSSTSNDPFSSNAPPVYNNYPLLPLPITTSQFGQYWSTSPHTTPLTLMKPVDPRSFLQTCLGFHVVEVIEATNEGIAAATFDSITILMHCKVANGRIDVMLKSADQNVGKVVADWIVLHC